MTHSSDRLRGCVRAAWPCSLALLTFVASLPATAQAEAPAFTLYLQQAWPRQSQTNAQIAQINDAFGTHFDDWGDVANLSLGGQLLWQVRPTWKVGVQVDYGSGAIDGHAQVMTEAGPATLEFEQRYDLYVDVMAVAQWRPALSSPRVQPFVYGGLGAAYESDTTTLKLHNDFIASGLRVENDGWFPAYTVGAGIDVPFSGASQWYVEVGAAYMWARMTNHVPAQGDLAPAPTVTADTDLTGPNVWLGVGCHF